MMSCECLDCRSTFTTDAPETSHGFRGLYAFIAGHRLCTRVYTCPDGTKFICKLGADAIRLYQ